MADVVKQILAEAIQLADLVIKAADEANSFKQECSDLNSKSEKLASLLRLAARASSDLYQRPALRIIDDTQLVLQKALALALKCRAANSFVMRLFTIIPTASFRKMSSQMDNSIGDVSWLLRVSAPAGEHDNEYLGLPPIAANEPILCLIWEQIAILCSGSLDDRSDAAHSLVSLARDNDRYVKLILEEGGVQPLLKLLKEGKIEGQESAARALGLLARDPETMEYMIHCGVCSTFANILKEGPMKVQAVVAWTVSELARNYPKCQDLLAQNNIIRLLVSHLAFETIQDHSKYDIASQKATTLHALVMAANNKSKNAVMDEDNSKIHHPLGNTITSQLQNVITTTMAMNAMSKPPTQCNANRSIGNGACQVGVVKDNGNGRKVHHQRSHSLSGANLKGRELEDHKTKSNMKAMAARALWHLAKGNSCVCRSITESRALLCFAVLLEKGPEDVQFNCVMALVEITAVAEGDADLRRSAFKPNSPASKAVVDQLFRIVEKAYSNLLIPCIKAIGNLARMFRAMETRMIEPLVKLLAEKEADVSREVLVTLTKFACTENYLHLEHSKAIINAGGAKHLIHLVYLGEQALQLLALVLVSYLALHVPDSKELARAEMLTVLEWASKQSYVTQAEKLDLLLDEAKSRLELYQSRGSMGFH